MVSAGLHLGESEGGGRSDSFQRVMAFLYYTLNLHLRFLPPYHGVPEIRECVVAYRIDNGL